MLTSYITDTQRLLQSPAPATAGLYSEGQITAAINKARRHLAIKGEVLRKIGTISTVAAQREYSFATIDIGVAATTGLAGVLNVRRINRVVGSGELRLDAVSWEWFDAYCLNDPIPEGNADDPGSRYPRTWAQYGQGGSASAEIGDISGSFYLDPLPDAIYELRLDCLCYPITLTDNNTVEAIPPMFTDAVPFIAAWYILLSAQNQARRADAEAYYKYGMDYIGVGREGSNPSVNRPIFEQANDPAQRGKAGAR